MSNAQTLELVTPENGLLPTSLAITTEGKDPTSLNLNQSTTFAKMTLPMLDCVGAAFDGYPDSLKKEAKIDFLKDRFSGVIPNTVVDINKAAGDMADKQTAQQAEAAREEKLTAADTALREALQEAVKHSKEEGKRVDTDISTLQPLIYRFLVVEDSRMGNDKAFALYASRAGASTIRTHCHSLIGSDAFSDDEVSAKNAFDMRVSRAARAAILAFSNYNPETNKFEDEKDGIGYDSETGKMLVKKNVLTPTVAVPDGKGGTIVQPCVRIETNEEGERVTVPDDTLVEMSTRQIDYLWSQAFPGKGGNGGNGKEITDKQFKGYCAKHHNETIQQCMAILGTWKPGKAMDIEETTVEHLRAIEDYIGIILEARELFDEDGDYQGDHAITMLHEMRKRKLTVC